MSSSCARRIPTSSFTFCSSWTENSIFPILGFSLLTNFGALLFVSLMWNRKKESSYRCASPSPCCRQRKEQLHWKFKKKHKTNELIYIKSTLFWNQKSNYIYMSINQMTFGSVPTLYTLICTTFVPFSLSKSPAACKSNLKSSFTGTDILNLSVWSDDWHFTINLAPVMSLPNCTEVINASVLVLSLTTRSGLFLSDGHIFVIVELLITITTDVVVFCGTSPLSDAKTCKVTRSGYKKSKHTFFS